ncbi:MAG: hypothetical protein WC479_06025 [Candidatus Izemoplasmatales bacterium]
MRIISFSKKWDKLKQPVFTTFRYPRKDRDWTVGEVVQVYYHNRSPNREKLGVAGIINKELRKIGTAFSEYQPTESEAIADGFKSLADMTAWFRDTHGKRIFSEPVYKLTLKWVSLPPLEVK